MTGPSPSPSLALISRSVGQFHLIFDELNAFAIVFGLHLLEALLLYLILGLNVALHRHSQVLTFLELSVEFSQDD